MRRHSRSASWSLGVVLVGFLLGFAGLATGCGSQGSAAESPSSSPSSTLSSPAAPVARSAAEFYAELVAAVRTARPSMSPETLAAHIRAVTKAPYAIIVAPYDPEAGSETDRMSKTEVATWGTDGALTTDIEELIHDSLGKSFHVERDLSFGSPFFFAGHPLKVGRRDAYVLVAMLAQ